MGQRQYAPVAKGDVMPGYYDWKMLNCGRGAASKVQSFLETLEAAEPYLERRWEAGGESFTDKEAASLAEVVAKLDEAEDALEDAKLKLATFLPGGPPA